MLNYNRLYSYLKANYWFRSRLNKEIEAAVLKIVDWYAFELMCGRDIKNCVELIAYEKHATESAHTWRREVTDKYDALNLEVIKTKTKHEEEIIRLKDIIQAKQVQIDKLLEGKNA